ncbi:hypothetical protein [Helicobacter rodentium]|nr:hypothetical protein [Helicobacter rodentium]
MQCFLYIRLWIASASPRNDRSGRHNDEVVCFSSLRENLKNFHSNL